MSVIQLLATSLGHRDDIANLELAKNIIEVNNADGVKELVEHLNSKNKGIRSDCIKTLYEIGEQAPSLIAGYTQVFVNLLSSKDNRTVWGAMCALSAIASVKPQEIFEHLAAIMDAAQKGSVITIDHYVKILVVLAEHKEYAETALTLLVDKIKDAAPNQLPTYAENMVPVMTDAFRAAFISTMISRLPDIETETKHKRLEKVIARMQKMK